MASVMPWSLLIPKGEFGNAAPELDPPDRVPLRQVLLVASSPRTGSNLLCRGLVGTGLAGQPEEYLNPHWSYLGWRRRVNRPSPTTRGAIGMMKRRLFGDEEWWRCYRWRPSSAKEYLAKVIDLRTSPNGVFSVKIHGLQFSHWQEEYGFDPSHWVDVPIRWVWLTRDDLMAQAVSYEIALQTNRWSVMADPSTRRAGQDAPREDVELRYDADRIEHALGAMALDRQTWSAYFAERKIEPLTLSYESIVADYTGAVRAVLSMLGEDVDVVPPERTARQASATNTEWIERFTAERPAVAASAGYRAS